MLGTWTKLLTSLQLEPLWYHLDGLGRLTEVNRPNTCGGGAYRSAR